MKKIIRTTEAPAPIGPYSQGVMHGDTLYVSGQIALNTNTGDLVIIDISAETHQVMLNLKAVLQSAGMDFSDVLKCSIFVKDMGDFEKINEVYGRFFEKNPPARETVEVSALPKGVNVEISCIAAKRS